MSDHDIAFFACPASLGDPQPAINRLFEVRQVTSLRAQFFAAVVGKVQTPAGVQTINVGANYPVEYARLLTLARCVATNLTGLPQFHDSQALVGLRQLVRMKPDISQVIVLLDALNDIEACEQLVATSSPGAFAWPAVYLQPDRTGPSHFIWNRHHPDAEEALDLALDIAFSGAIYGFEPYSLIALLDDVTKTLSVARAFEECLN